MIWFKLIEKKGYTFNNNADVCVTEKGTFGSKCNPKLSTSQCNTGLLCSSIGYYTGYCLYDIGGKCSNDYDCANLLHCQLNGTCGCGVINSSFSALNRMIVEKKIEDNFFTNFISLLKIF